MALLPKQPLASRWRGLNLRVAPHLLEEGESPETVNTAHKSDKVGVLGARRGRAKMSNTAYSGNVVGLIPFTFKGTQRLLVATDDGCIYDGAAFFPGGTAWVPPAAATYGKLISWTTAGVSASVAAAAYTSYATTVCSIDITGRKSLICSVLDCAASSAGTLTIQANLDGTWTTIGSYKISTVSSALQLANQLANEKIDVTGKVTLQGLRARIQNNGGSTGLVSFGGTVAIMLCDVALADAVAV
jgi:hypothetical protein